MFRRARDRHLGFAIGEISDQTGANASGHFDLRRFG
jgi:hypothetical protein